MFVKWKRVRHHIYPCTVSAAYLVKSVRTPKGPRHKHVCYLGSVTRPDDTMWGDKQGKFLADEIIAPFTGREGVQHCQFWATVLCNLDEAGIVGEDRDKVIAALERHIPRPDGYEPSEEDRVAVWERSRVARERIDRGEGRAIRRAIERRKAARPDEDGDRSP
jgi:hypothetical protein